MMTRTDWIAANPLRAWRKANKVSIAAAAAALDVSQQTVGYWEHGTSDPRDGNMTALGDLMGTKRKLLRKWEIWRKSMPEFEVPSRRAS